MSINELKVAKCTETELDEVRDFLQNLNDIVSDNEHYEQDDEINKEIADVARKIPYRNFIVTLNLGILLDNYQDKESNIIEHPKWIIELYKKIEVLEKNQLDLELENMRILCGFQHWLGSHYDNLPTDSTEMTKRAILYKKHLNLNLNNSSKDITDWLDTL